MKLLHPMVNFRIRNSVAAALVVLGGVAAASAQTSTWSNDASGLWSNGANWFSGTAADGSGNTANFGQIDITGDRVVSLDSPRQIGNLIFGDTGTSTSGNWILGNNGNPANILTLVGGSTPTITVNAMNVSSGSSRAAYITLELAGSQGLTKDGTGVLVLAGNNSYTGTTTITSGTLQIGNGGTSGSVQGNIFNNNALSTSTLFFNRSDAYTFDGTISGAGRLSIAGTGTINFTANNTYTGLTSILGGATLRGTDTTVYASGSTAMKTVFGTNSTIAMTSGANLQIRANGLNNGTAQVMNLAQSIQYSGGNGTIGIDVDRESGSGTGKTISFSAGNGLNIATSTSGPTTVNVTGGNGYNLQVSNIAMGGGAASGTLVLNPTTANLFILNGVVNSGAAGSYTKTLQLAGTSSGNTLAGSINNNNATGLTAVTKAGSSTWTLSGSNSAYSGATAVSAGTLIVNGDSLAATVTGSSVSLDATADTITMTGNPLVNGDRIVFAASTTPTGLVLGTSYYVINQSGNSFQVSTTPGGSAVNFSGVGTSVTVSQPGSLGSSSSAIVLGDANTGANNIQLLTGGGNTIGRALTVANQGLGTTIGGNANANSTFSGAITANKDFTVSQVATTGANTLSVTGGISAGTAGTKTVTFSGPGAIRVATNGISDGSGKVAVNVTGGTTSFTANNTYTGTTTVTAGTLVLTTAGSNNIASSAAIKVLSGAKFDVTGVGSGFALAGGQTLMGTGTVVGSLTVTANSTLSPGNSPGLLSTGNQIWQNGGNYNWQVYDATGAAGTGFDSIAINGSLDLTGLTGASDFNINLWSLSSITPDTNGDALNFNAGLTQSWVIVSTTGGITGFNLSNFTINDTAFNGTGGFSNDFDGTFSLAVSGNDLLLTYTAVPEPGTVTLLALGGTVLMALRKRKRISL